MHETQVEQRINVPSPKGGIEVLLYIYLIDFITLATVGKFFKICQSLYSYTCALKTDMDDAHRLI